MKKEYQEEVNQVHAPQELIEKTKNKMKQESQRVGKIDKKLLRISSFSAIAATIVLSFILISLIFTKTPISDSSLSNQKSIHLSNGNKEPEQITKSEENNDEAVYIRDGLNVFAIQKVPEDFQKAITEKDSIGDIPILLIKDADSHFYKAVVEVNRQKYLVLSELIEVEEFMNAVKEFVNSMN